MRKAMPLALACLMLSGCAGLSGCATAGGVQVEGRASQVTAPPTTQPPPSDVTPSFDSVAVLRSDPQVSAAIKATLVPCLEDRYPIDSRYVDLTRDGSPELVVTVVACDEKIISPTYDGNTLAVYVYNLKTTPPTGLFAMEESGVALFELRDAGFQLNRVRYQASDKPCCPSGFVPALYRWNGTAFEQVRK